MKRYCFVLFVIATACSNPNADKEKKTGDVIVHDEEVNKTVETDTSCFILTEGRKNQDTQAVKLAINGNDVTGKLFYMPSEKDWRFGNLRGTKDGDMLTLMWVYVQEGMKDSTQVVFKIDANTLLQKPFSYDNKTGKEFISDTSQFTMKYQQVDCSNFPKHDFDLGI